jgi:hypothetical protein
MPLPKGFHHSQATKDKISKGHLGRPRPDMMGENNPNWHGEEYTIKGARFMAWKLYHGICPKGMQIHHIDGNPRNNNRNNIAFLTPRAHFDLHCKDEKFTYHFVHHSRVFTPEGRRRLSEFAKQRWQVYGGFTSMTLVKPKKRVEGDYIQEAMEKAKVVNV